jgi:hypothetical protein
MEQDCRLSGAIGRKDAGRTELFGGEYGERVREMRDEIIPRQIRKAARITSRKADHSTCL